MMLNDVLTQDNFAFYGGLTFVASIYVMYQYVTFVRYLSPSNEHIARIFTRCVWLTTSAAFITFWMALVPFVPDDEDWVWELPYVLRPFVYIALGFNVGQLCEAMKKG